jgi:hypothetical protein
MTLYETIQHCFPQRIRNVFMLQFQHFHYIKRLTNCPRLLIHLKSSGAPQHSDEGPSGPNFSGQTITKFSKILPTKLGQRTRYNVLATASITEESWTDFRQRQKTSSRALPAFYPTRTVKPYPGDKAVSIHLHLAPQLRLNGLILAVSLTP